jgi:hypothetical protein
MKLLPGELISKYNIYCYLQIEEARLLFSTCKSISKVDSFQKYFTCNNIPFPENDGLETLRTILTWLCVIQKWGLFDYVKRRYLLGNYFNMLWTYRRDYFPDPRGEPPSLSYIYNVHLNEWEYSKYSKYSERQSLVRVVTITFRPYFEVIEERNTQRIEERNTVKPSLIKIHLILMNKYNSTLFNVTARFSNIILQMCKLCNVQFSCKKRFYHGVIDLIKKYGVKWFERCKSKIEMLTRTKLLDC